MNDCLSNNEALAREGIDTVFVAIRNARWDINVTMRH